MTEATVFDVFLSHNSRDKPAVERLAERLKRAGLEPWLDKWCLTPGGNWQNELMDGLRAARACAFFLGPHGEGAWAREELHVALDRAAKERDFRLFLVLLPGIEEPFDVTVLPPFLSTRTWVDLRKGADDGRSFQTLIHAIKGVPLGPDVPIAPRDDVCPYRGLQPFDAEHADYFFGRDADTQRLLEKLKTARFLAVLGSSGSGKSSLVRAGLVPALGEGALPGSADWAVRILTPSAHPLEALAAQLVRLDPTQGMARTVDALRADPRTLHLAATLALADRPPGERLVCVIDQCEELFALCQSEAERTAFLDNLLYAATIPDGRVIGVVTMRADFYPRCAAHPDFSTRVAAQQFLVSPLTVDGLRQCIAEPARRVGLELEQGLVDTILDDIGAQPGALPLLEHALLELWERRRGYVLTLEGYRESGGVQGAIAQRADAIFQNFDADQQAIARRSLLRLTQPGQETEDTRRRATLGELVTTTAETAAVEAVVRELADARLLTTSGQAESALVDISHEALIRSWPRFRQWIEEDRNALRVHRRLTEAVEEWQRLDCDDSALWRGARLAEALEWRPTQEAALNEGERAFLDASRRLRDNELAERDRRRRRISVGLGVGLILAVLLASLAAWQWRGAEEQRQVALTAQAQAEVQRQLAVTAQGQAEGQRQVALARQLGAQAELTRSRRPDLQPLSVLLAAEGLRRDPSPSAEQFLRGSLALLAGTTTTVGHGDIVWDAAFSPDGRWAASAGRDGTTRVWEVATGREVARLAQGNSVNTIAFRADSQWIATGGADRNARLWELPSGRLLGTFPEDDTILSVALSPDGAQLVTGAGNGRVRVWDVASGQEQTTMSHDNIVQRVALSPDGRSVASASWDGTARLWDAATGAPIARLVHDADSFVLRVVFSPDGRLVATAATDRTARVWEVPSGREVGRFAHESLVQTVAFSPNGQLLASGGADRAVRLWEVGSGRSLGRVAHDNTVTTVAFSGDNVFLVTGGADGTARIWKVTTGQELARLPHSDEVTAVAFSPDGQHVLTASRDGAARVWAADGGGSVRHWTHRGGVVDAVLAPDGEKLVGVSPDGSVLAWRASDGAELWRGQHDGAVRAVAFSRDGAVVATGSADRTVRIWDARSGAELLRLPHDDTVLAVGFSMDGNHLATASGDSSVRVWERAGRLVQRFSHQGGDFAAAFDDELRIVATAGLIDGSVHVYTLATGQESAAFSLGRTLALTVAISPGGRYLAAGTIEGQATVWDLTTQQEISRVRQVGLVNRVAFSPDTALLAVASSEGAAVVWDWADRQEMARFTHRQGLWAARFSPEGRYLATASLDGTARLWPWRGDTLLTVACALVGRNLSSEEWRQYLGDEPYRPTCSESGR